MKWTNSSKNTNYHNLPNIKDHIISLYLLKNVYAHNLKFSQKKSLVGFTRELIKHLKKN